MPHRTVRAILPIAGLSLLVAASVADAQVTIDMTTQLQTNCTAVTDASGLRLAPNGNHLQATGVTLTGEGCGGGTAGAGSDFAATVNAPANATAGTPFDVTWSAAADATRCTYGGTAGASGWPVGTTACQDGACTGSHTASVVVPAAGNYSFSMTCTNASGYAQAATTATGGSGGAPTPPNFALTAPATGTTGTSFNVSWSVTGATTCTGSASLNGSSTSLPGWTTSTAATSPRSVTPTVAGVYTLTLACSNSSGSVTSQPAVVTVTQGSGDSCPAGRQTVADVCYSYGPSNCAANSDVTKFENFLGRSTPTGTPVPFPGKQGFAIFKNMQKTQYISMKFVAPATPLTSRGQMWKLETTSGPNSDVSISSTCGNFAPVDPKCVVNNVPRGGPAAAWKLPGYSGLAFCPLIPGETYYLNIRQTDPAATIANECSGSTCNVGMQNNFNQ